jgi:hypothetical protein
LIECSSKISCGGGGEDRGYLVALTVHDRGQEALSPIPYGLKSRRVQAVYVKAMVDGDPLGAAEEVVQDLHRLALWVRCGVAPEASMAAMEDSAVGAAAAAGPAAGEAAGGRKKKAKKAAAAGAEDLDVDMEGAEALLEAAEDLAAAGGAGGSGGVSGGSGGGGCSCPSAEERRAAAKGKRGGGGGRKKKQ